MGLRKPEARIKDTPVEEVIRAVEKKRMDAKSPFQTMPLITANSQALLMTIL